MVPLVVVEVAVAGRVVVEVTAPRTTPLDPGDAEVVPARGLETGVPARLAVVVPLVVRFVNPPGVDGRGARPLAVRVVETEVGLVVLERGARVGVGEGEDLVPTGLPCRTVLGAARERGVATRVVVVEEVPVRVRAERFETPVLGTGLTPLAEVGVPGLVERTELTEVADPALLGAWLVAGDWPREAVPTGARTGAGDLTEVLEEGRGVVLEVVPVVLPAVPVREEGPPDDVSAFLSASSLAMSFSRRRSWMALD